jgi:outer membrane efflux protein
MKRTAIFLVAMAFISLQAFSQSRITIEECYQKAQDNYPAIEQYDLIEKSKSFNLENASKGYLPQITFSAKASYQSDVTKLPIDISQLGIGGFQVPELSKDQYGLTLDINQTIWDGGQIKTLKENIKSKADVQRKNLQVNIYSINARVNQIYFGILLADAQIKQNNLLKEYLHNSYNKVEAYVRNGIAHQADLDAIRIDQLKAEQNEIEYLSTRKAYIAMLSKLTGCDLTSETEFVRPDMIRPASNEVKRFELDLYKSQIQEYEIENRKITVDLYPKIGLFVTGGYGKPGLNMLENKFSTYYTAGVKLSWNIGSFYSLKNNRKLVRNNIDMVINQQKSFLFDLDMELIQKNIVLDKYFDQLKYDDEIISLKGSVREASEAKIAGGTISGTDLMQDVNAEHAAKQDKVLHEIQLLMVIYDLKYTTNNY